MTRKCWCDCDPNYKPKPKLIDVDYAKAEARLAAVLRDNPKLNNLTTRPCPLAEGLRKELEE